MSNIRIYPYKMGSQSAKALAGALDARCVYADRNYRGNPNHVMINWGNTQFPEQWGHNVGLLINRPQAVNRACNKARCTMRLAITSIPVVPFSNDKEVAERWIEQGIPVIVRHVMTGHSGNGIELVESGELPDARMYTQYLGSRREYRLHVVGDSVVYTQQKKRRDGARELPNYSEVIRNHGTGWVYCADDITPLPDEAEDIAVRAVAALHLQFGAVDIITRQGRVYVLEVNTAPGLEGRSIEIYRDALLQLIDSYND